MKPSITLATALSDPTSHVLDPSSKVLGESLKTPQNCIKKITGIFRDPGLTHTLAIYTTPIPESLKILGNGVVSLPSTGLLIGSHFSITLDYRGGPSIPSESGDQNGCASSQKGIYPL